MGKSKTLAGSGAFSGRTIVAKREKVQSESERMLAREKAKKKKTFSIIVSVLVLIIVIFGGFMAARIVFRKVVAPEAAEEKFEPTIAIVDEGKRGVTEKMRAYVGTLEADLSDLGLQAKKAVVPADKAREVDVYLAGVSGYFKCSLDRGTAETAEDIQRMMKYLSEVGVKKVTYVDVRIQGRGYWK